MKFAPRDRGIEQNSAHFAKIKSKYEIDEIMKPDAKICNIPQIQLHKRVHVERRCQMRLLTLS